MTLRQKVASQAVGDLAGIDLVVLFLSRRDRPIRIVSGLAENTNSIICEGSIAEHEGAIRRFEREAQIASALNHPNICTIYGFGQYEGKPFISMELLEGQSLSARLAQSRAPLAMTTLFDIAIQVCSALQAAHAKGIIHRDVKPANIFLTKDGPVKILDFGLAKLVSTEGEPQDATGATTPFPSGVFGKTISSTTFLENQASLTLTGSTFAEPSVTCLPSKFVKKNSDARTDLFSFGLVLYEMATGCRAFPGESAVIVHEAILNRQAASAREVISSLPRRLNEIISKALKRIVSDDTNQRRSCSTIF